MKIADYLPKSRKTYFIIAFILITTIGLSIYLYQTVLKKMINPIYVENREFVPEAPESARDSNVQIVFFTVDWCPYCKKSLPIWKEFCDKYDGHLVNGYTLSCETFNCTDENDHNVKSTIEKYEIEGYPTIKMIKNGEVFDYDAKPTMEHLEEWVRVTLN